MVGKTTLRRKCAATLGEGADNISRINGTLRHNVDATGRITVKKSGRKNA